MNRPIGPDIIAGRAVQSFEAAIAEHTDINKATGWGLYPDGDSELNYLDTTVERFRRRGSQDFTDTDDKDTIEITAVSGVRRLSLSGYEQRRKEQQQSLELDIEDTATRYQAKRNGGNNG